MQQKVADREEQEPRVGEVRQVEHVPQQIPELPERGVRDHLLLGDRGHAVAVDVRTAARPQPVALDVEHGAAIGETVPMHPDVLEVGRGQPTGMLRGAGAAQLGVRADLALQVPRLRQSVIGLLTWFFWLLW